MPKYLTSSTLWYSGIFAAAATFDAGVKNKRREQWDRAIAEVKQDLGKQAVTENEELKDVRHEAFDDVEEAKLQYKPLDGLSEDEDIFRYTDARREKPRWPANTGPDLVAKRLAPESIYATDDRKEWALKQRWGPKKLATVQTSIEILQLRIFQHLHARGLSQFAADAVPEDYAKCILQEPQNLEAQSAAKFAKLKKILCSDSYLDDYQPPKHDRSLCNFRQDDAGQFHRTVGQLNSSLQELFQRSPNKGINQAALLAKVSYNLSLSSAPPNLNTYNTLLLGFSNLREHSLVKHVIISMCETHMRMNEVSLSAILKHYTKTDDVRHFVRLVERIRGKHGGIALARSDITITHGGSPRLLQQPDGKIIQLPYPTPIVFGAAIAGVIKFAGFDKALSLCQGMGREGWGLCMSGLTPLLQDCAARGDWTSGLAVWKKIQELKFKSRMRQGAEYVSERIGLDTFAAMLRLCSRAKQQEIFEDVWRQASYAHRNSIERLARLVNAQNGEEAESAKHLDVGTSSQADYGLVPQSEEDVLPSPEDQIREPSTRSALDERQCEQHVETLEMQSPPTQRLVARDEIDVDTLEMQSSRDASEASNTSAGRDTNANSLRQTTQVQRKVLDKRYSPPRQPPHLLEEQLFGLLPPSHELDEYELRERPMTVCG